MQYSYNIINNTCTCVLPDKLWTLFLSDYMYLQSTVVHTNIKTFALFRDILYFWIFRNVLILRKLLEEDPKN